MFYDFLIGDITVIEILKNFIFYEIVWRFCYILFCKIFFLEKLYYFFKFLYKCLIGLRLLNI